MTDLSKLRSVSAAYKEMPRRKFVSAEDQARSDRLGAFNLLIMSVVTVAVFSFPMIVGFVRHWFDQ